MPCSFDVDRNPTHQFSEGAQAGEPCACGGATYVPQVGRGVGGPGHTGSQMAPFQRAAGRADAFADEAVSPAMQRVLDAAERLTYSGQFVYGAPRGDDTPKPTCAGCSASDWTPDRIRHRPGCAVQELVEAVRVLSRHENR